MSHTIFYSLRPFTNLHVGGGDAGLAIIDNYIQRDPASGLPCVYSSSLKGAIKQMLDFHNVSATNLKSIFGSNAKKGKGEPENEKYQQGESAFFSAHLLALAVPCDKAPFVLVTCPSVLVNYRQLRSDLGQPLSDGGKKQLDVFETQRPETGKKGICLDGKLNGADLRGSGIRLEKTADTQLDGQKLLKLFAPDIQDNLLCLVSDEDFVDLCSNYNLPVIARNSLDDGESDNLWYEQVLPRESLLWFAIQWKDDTQRKLAEDSLLKHPLQLGANASVGYGYTRIAHMAGFEPLS